MIRNLTDSFLQISPKVFGTSKQIYILRRKARIDDALENLQRTFSMPAFFIIVANFLSCGTVIGWFLFVDLSQYQFDVIIRDDEYLTNCYFLRNIKKSQIPVMNTTVKKV
ncbi:hypothetical protein AVEN_124162-1 [Araneus ventricosus]|uniref:Uncharacterized protein n=1 Tax=Araneus ventricosus TaxID=182803 RepID=A0A4Y2P0D0_ARAVE|nr:hypothetical protein AVEN_124162-1 [Araneus ventricosus]